MFVDKVIVKNTADNSRRVLYINRKNHNCVGNYQISAQDKTPDRHLCKYIEYENKYIVKNIYHMIGNIS